jgi:hypothetical protein
VGGSLRFSLIVSIRVTLVYTGGADSADKLAEPTREH